MDLAQRTETFGNHDHGWLGSAAGTAHPRTVTAKVSAFTAGVHYPGGYLPAGLPLAIPTSGANAGYAVPLVQGANEVQTITFGGTVSGGTFTITLDGETTAAIAYNATTAAVQAALEGLSNLAPGDVTVTGSAGAYVLTYGGASAGRDVPAVTYTSSLTGTSPTITVATTTGGGSGVTDGSDVLAGFLLYAVAVNAASTGVQGALIDTGRIVAARLPIALTAATKAASGRFVFI